MTLARGSRVGAYELLEPLGSGGMGEVWLATEVRLGRKVALKVLPADLTRDPSRVQRFEQEARAASALNHPNVCTIHALGETADGQHYIAMEYVEGETLRRRLAAGRPAIREALDIAIQVASALTAAHAAGIIHRDIKPENVMLRPDGFVKVLDFGLAKLASTAFEGADTTQIMKTDAGVVVGTAAYMSPEQARGEALDPRTDIFSLGAFFYEMVTGRRAFAGSSTAILVDAILNQVPTSALRLNPEVPPRLEDIINKALEKERDFRYQSVSELRSDLMRLKRDWDERSGGARATTAGLRNIGRRATVALLLIIVGIGTILVIQGRDLQFLFHRSELRERQLTTNSSEDPVSAAAISPDGKYIAYADQGGTHVRMIGSGETHTILGRAVGGINRLAWFPDGSKLVVSGTDAAGMAIPSIWSVSLIGGDLRKLRDDGMEASVSPDASQIAFVDGKRHNVWAMGANGEEPHQVVTNDVADAFHLPAYWSDGALVYGRVQFVGGKSGSLQFKVSLESRDREGHTVVLLTDPGLRAAIRLPDGRLIYSLVAEPALNHGASLWETHDGRQTALLRGKPRRLSAQSGSVSYWQFTTTADGKRIAFLKRSPQKDVYIADLGPGGDPVNAQRLTLDDSDDFPTNWSPDGGAILFTSDRNGNFDIFKQSLDRRGSEPLVTGPDDEMGPTAVSPDGASFYYFVQPKGWRSTAARRTTLMRTPAVGGPPQILGEAASQWALCARSPSTSCVVVEEDRNEVEIYALDAVHGKGSKITSTEVNSVTAFHPSSLSPDGLRLAVETAPEGPIRILFLGGQPSRDVRITGWRLDPAPLFWSADGGALYVSATSVIGGSEGTDLLRVDLNGGVRVVWHQSLVEPVSGIPSPDGRHLALTQTSTVSNVWMMTDF